jgi:hypothetical protein
MSCHFPRSGGKGLKATQVYPDGFGRKVCALHKPVLVLPAGLLQCDVHMHNHA